MSASVLLASGLNATIAWSDRSNSEAVGPDQNAATIKLGYKVGSNAFTVEPNPPSLSYAKQIMTDEMIVNTLLQ